MSRQRDFEEALYATLSLDSLLDRTKLDDYNYIKYGGLFEEIIVPDNKTPLQKFTEGVWDDNHAD